MNVFTVVGIIRADFVAKDGTSVKGFNIYMEKPLESAAESIGIMTKDIYLSENKLRLFNLNVNTLVGSKVEVSFNSYGKPRRVIVKN